MENNVRTTQEKKTDPRVIISAGSSIKKSVTFTLLSALSGFIMIIIFFSSAMDSIVTMLKGGKVDGGDFMGIYIFAFLAGCFWVASLMSLFSAGCSLKGFVEPIVEVKSPKIKTLQIPENGDYKKSEYSIKATNTTKTFLDGKVDESLIEFSNGLSGKVYFSHFENRYYFFMPDSKDTVKYTSKESAIYGLDYFLQTTKIAEES